MGVRTALNRLTGLTEPFQRRPSRLNFMGVNHDSAQTQNLVAAFPMWEPPEVACFDFMPPSLVGQPFNVLQGYDPDFGDVYIGDGIGSGGTTDGSRGYKFLNAEIKPYIDFGLGPSPFSLAFWFRSLTAAPATDMYLIAFDDPLSSPVPFSGFAVSLDTSNQMACNTGNPNETDVGFKSDFNPYDGKWHHFLFTHFPRAGVSTSTNTYYIDGRFDAQRTTCAAIGQCNNHLYIGVDDDGLSQQFGGAFCDFRVYGAELQLPDAQRMYHPDTRWELYNPRRKGWTLFPGPTDATPAQQIPAFDQALSGGGMTGLVWR